MNSQNPKSKVRLRSLRTRSGLLAESDDHKHTDLVQAISRAINHVKMGKHDPLLAYETLKDVYSWKDVAERTELVYRNALRVKRVPVVERLRR